MKFDLIIFFCVDDSLNKFHSWEWSKQGSKASSIYITKWYDFDDDDDNEDDGGGYDDGGSGGV